MLMYNSKMDFQVKDKIILCVGAHPDDLEFGCAGTVAKWVNRGATVYYVVLTDGSKGSEDLSLSDKQLSEIRRKEQEKAAGILGVKKVYFQNFVDGELTNNAGVRKELLKIIRELRPDIVITLDPTLVYDENTGFINHPDHRTAGLATLEAIFPFARNSRTCPELLDQGYQSHNVREVMLVNFTKSNFFVDISKTLDKKILALSAHKSQHDDLEKISSMVKQIAKRYGKRADLEYAEGFVRVTINH